MVQCSGSANVYDSINVYGSAKIESINALLFR